MFYNLLIRFGALVFVLRTTFQAVDFVSFFRTICLNPLEDTAMTHASILELLGRKVGANKNFTPFSPNKPDSRGPAIPLVSISFLLYFNEFRNREPDIHLPDGIV
jgi:hypothetical protein